jgi:hypothetical protein
MKSKQEFGLTQQKQSLSLFKTGKKQLVKSDLENRVYHDQEGEEVFLRSAHGLTKVLWRKKKHQINTYLKDIISTVTDSDELYILALLRLKQS